MNMKSFGKKILRIIKDDIMFYGSAFEPRFEVTLTSTIVSDSFMPRDYTESGGD